MKRYGLRNRVGGREAPEDGKLLTRFYYDKRDNPTRTEKAGYLVQDLIEMVEIRSPGSTEMHPKEVSEDVKNRFCERYPLWLEENEPPKEGFWLAQWPMLNIAQVSTYAGIGIKTLEQLSTLSKEVLRDHPEFQSDHERAKIYLDNAESGAHVMRLKLENERLLKELSAIQSANEDLANSVQSLRQQLASQQQAVFQPQYVAIPTTHEPVEPLVKKKAFHIDSVENAYDDAPLLNKIKNKVGIESGISIPTND